MGKVRVVFSGPAIESILKSGDVRAELKSRADAIAAACGPTMEPGVDMVAGVDMMHDRARGYVVTATVRAMRGEAKDRRLTRAIDAGRHA